MVTIQYNGRLGNQIIQYIAASIFSEKHDLYFDFRPKKTGDYDLTLLLKQTAGHKKNDGLSPIEIVDVNFFEYLNKDKIETLIHFNGYFQMREFIAKYENEIIERYIYLNSDKKDDDKYLIHLRMGDLVDFIGNLNYDYYKTCIQLMNKPKGYIITDSPNSELLKKLVNDFNLELYHQNEINDFKFATTFNNVILSQGSYSFLIGLFSRAKKVFYSSRPPNWTGDIFLHNRWFDVYKNNIL